jgi:hypothetical protein
MALVHLSLKQEKQGTRLHSLRRRYSAADTAAIPVPTDLVRAGQSPPRRAASPPPRARLSGPGQARTRGIQLGRPPLPASPCMQAAAHEAARRRRTKT